MGCMFDADLELKVRLPSLVGISREKKERVNKLGWHGNSMQDFLICA